MKLPAWLHIHPSRLASAPAAHVLSTTSDITRVRIDGLVCGVCASRTRTALERLPGVRHAHVNLETSTATLELDSQNVHSINSRDLDTALRTVVLGMWARRLIEHSINFLKRHWSSTREGRA